MNERDQDLLKQALEELKTAHADALRAHELIGLLNDQGSTEDITLTAYAATRRIERAIRELNITVTLLNNKQE